MRGQRLFKEAKKEFGMSPAKRGRNDALLTRRNECLVSRYYYYTRFREKGYEEIISALITEFFLSPERIVNIIRENAAVLEAVKEAEPSVYFFKNHWPHIKW